MLLTPMVLLMLSMPMARQAVIEGPKDCATCLYGGAQLKFAASITLEYGASNKIAELDIPGNAKLILNCDHLNESNPDERIQIVKVVWQSWLDQEGNPSLDLTSTTAEQNNTTATDDTTVGTFTFTDVTSSDMLDGVSIQAVETESTYSTGLESTATEIYTTDESSEQTWSTNTILCETTTLLFDETTTTLNTLSTSESDSITEETGSIGLNTDIIDSEDASALFSSIGPFTTSQTNVYEAGEDYAEADTTDVRDWMETNLSTSSSTMQATVSNGVSTIPVCDDRATVSGSPQTVTVPSIDETEISIEETLKEGGETGTSRQKSGAHSSTDMTQNNIELFENELILWFVQKDTEYFVQRVALKFQLDSIIVPGFGQIKNFSVSREDLKILETPNGYSHVCKGNVSFNLNSRISLQLSNIEMTAFNPNCSFPCAYYCGSKLRETNEHHHDSDLTVVTIVGIVLGVLAVCGGVVTLCILYSRAEISKPRELAL